MREASVKNAVTVELKNGESLSDLQRDGLQIIQHPGLFSFGIDAVLLSGFAEIREGDRVADLGTGTGILPILLAAKTKAAHLTGLEILAESADMAERSVRMNGLDDRISIVPGDIRKVEDYFTTASMDAVVSNPPYMIADHGRGNPNGAIAAARHELLCTFDDVARAASYLLRSSGRFSLVHRPFRLPELFETLRKYHLEPKRMRLVHPFADREPNLVSPSILRSLSTASPAYILTKCLRSMGMTGAELPIAYGRSKNKAVNRARQVTEEDSGI